MIPKRVILMVLYFAIQGGTSLSTMWRSLNDGHFYFDLGILMLPVAYGLLRGRPHARIEAQVWFMLTYVLAGVAIWQLPNHREVLTPGTWINKSLGSLTTERELIIIASGFLVLNVTFHILLWTRRAQDFFKLNEAATALARHEKVKAAEAKVTAPPGSPAGPEIREAEVIEITEKEPAKADPL